MTQTINHLSNSALWYAKNGYAVFPLSPNSKIPFKGSRGYLDATTDPEKIAAWWADTPDANIGIATTGLCVPDFDLYRDRSWFDTPQVKAAVNASPMRQKTPSGGLHVVYAQPANADWRISASTLANAVDVRANGGYIVAAPSSIDGAEYSWETGPAPRAELPTPPDWLAERISSLSATRSNLAGTWDDWKGEKIGVGSRHQALLSWAGLFRSWGLEGIELEAALLAINTNRCDPPSPEKEVRRIARDYSRKAVDEAKANAVVDGGFSLSGLDARLNIPTATTSDPGPVPAELLCRIPGFVADVIEYSLSTAPYPNAALSWAGAISLLSFLTARKVQFENIASNTYILGLALSGGGKEHPRKVNAEILSALGLQHQLGDRFASAEGLEDALASTPSLLFQTDEIDGMLEASSNTKETRFRSIRDMILSLFGESSSVHVGRRKAGGSEQAIIHRPSLTLFGTAIPEHCYGAMTEEMVTKGLLSRMLVIDSARGERQPWKRIDLPKQILEVAAFWKDFNPGGGNLNPTPLEIGLDEGAAVFFSGEDQAQDAIYQQAQRKHDNVTCGMSSRIMLQAKKLALLWACSEWEGKAGTRPVISLEAAKWGMEIVSHLSKRTLAMYLKNSKTSLDFEKRVDKLLGYITNSGGKVDHTSATRHMRLPKRDFDALIATLVDRGVVSSFVGTTNGRPTRGYQSADLIAG